MAAPASAEVVLTAKDVIIPIVTIVGSFAGAWIASKLALDNFYQQKVWERKAVTYTAIFEAIHKIERWYAKHWDALVEGKDVDAEDKETLRIEAKKGEDALELRLAGEAWFIPDEFHSRAMNMIIALQKTTDRNSTWSEFL